MGPGAGVSHSGPAGRSTRAAGDSGRAMAGGGGSFGPGTGFGGGMTGGYQSYGPPQTDNFQSSQYGYPDSLANNFNVPYGPESSTTYQQNQYQGVLAGPALASTVPAPGGFASLQARGIMPGTCLWECTAEYTPIECQQRCR